MEESKRMLFYWSTLKQVEKAFGANDPFKMLCDL